MAEGDILLSMVLPAQTSTLNISLPKPLRRYVDNKVASGIYGSASEFVREAIREKLQRDEARGVVTAKLVEGLESGEPIPVNSSYFKNKKRTLARKARSSRPPE